MICNSKNWKEVTDIATLKDIRNDPMGPRHVPVNHGAVLEVFQDTVKGIQGDIVKEKGMLSPDTKRFIFAREYKLKDAEMNFTVGFINYNDRSRSLVGICGEKVIICSNQMFTGIIQPSRRRHTNKIDEEMADKFDAVAEYFQNTFVGNRMAEIAAMKAVKVDDGMFGQVILDIHRKEIMGNTDITRVVKEWDKPTYDVFKEHTAWNLVNTYTQVRKRFENPTRAMQIDADFSNIVSEKCGVKVATASGIMIDA